MPQGVGVKFRGWGLAEDLGLVGFSSRFKLGVRGLVSGLGWQEAPFQSSAAVDPARRSGAEHSIWSIEGSGVAASI